MAARWSKRRLTISLLLSGIFGILYYQSKQHIVSPWGNVLPPGSAPLPHPEEANGGATTPVTPVDDGKFHWSQVELQHPIPVESMRPVPSPNTVTLKGIPKIQHSFKTESAAAREVRLARLELVRANFTHAWNGYKTHAWMGDEVRPLKGTPVSKFGGWAATLVDTLDTLWIMGLHAEFQNAVNAVDQIDFSTTNLDQVNVFETTIRYLGGFLAAYDLSDGQYPSLLAKATELGDMLYLAFDTPNHVVVTRWKMNDRRKGISQTPHRSSLVSELGSLSLEFTRLSQLTGNPKYYDAVQRIMDLFEAQQDRTHLPGLWPVVVNAEAADFTGGTGFTIGGMADSLYEYLPKQFLLLGGAVPAYRTMYLKALAAMSEHLFFRPLTKSAKPLLFPGDKNTNGKLPADTVRTLPKVQHLGCFAGGMVGLAARLFDRPADMAVAEQLVEGCLWAYESAPFGIMPEIMSVAHCATGAASTPCVWDEKTWLGEVAAKQRPGGPKKNGDADSFNVAKVVDDQRLVPGVLRYEDRRYILRPEAIESVFILYRLTGDATLMDRAWGMFESIVKVTQTSIAHTAVDDCTQPLETWADSMESFWLAETLKYFYLIFEDPQVVSLDTYVLNTEAHPLRRPA
ncbi:mannosyl-oligosaccharide alpha-1,2-mannosidase [Sporothrix schenckii 1099-18]|uniref:alpha-1,2-Mannosidase n=1 Tax=Sporothrix schenckii 1099-18 TaxID=1397361 RepID=A0A0F2M3N8_SPOSC|nr:mannosyl-oligosaccharide alpha-1,2-mannosidase [Sporothrix schenckii 1099-18]KJR84282.1 mannosyl-oligosaccharide alpha-1,2-mannosidase [Sporothrix schenckii 1099-18]